MDYLKKTLFSYWFTVFCLAILGLGAAVATFIENDYGTTTAKVLVYNNLWYEIFLVLSCVNIAGIVYLRKMWKKPSKFILHTSFVVILVGAALTRYIGFEGIMHIREGEATNKMLSLETYLQLEVLDNNQTYLQSYPMTIGAFGKDFKYSFTLTNGKIITIAYNDFKYAKQGKEEMNLLKADIFYGDKKETVTLVGRSGMKGIPAEAVFGDVTVVASFGSKELELPFAIALRDFELERYPGSMSPSSYASEVTLKDEKNNKQFDYRIFMNNTLEYRDFKFFQSSYDQDEKGTILSVNNDPGKWPTYFGYFLLTLGFLWILFDKESRFSKLSKYIKSFSTTAVLILLSFNAITLEANNIDYLKQFREDSKQSAHEFGKLIVQDRGGRMKPLNTLNHEIVAKITRKGEFFGMNPDQIVLGMLTRPDIWKDVKMIRITTPKLKLELGIPSNENYIAFTDIFTPRNEYRLEKFVNEANAKKPSERGTFEKDVLQIDERMNIAYMVFSGNIFKLFPVPDDKNNKWLSPVDAITTLAEPQRGASEILIKGYLSAIYDHNYTKAGEYLTGISNYQKKIGSAIYPNEQKIAAELFMNKFQPFWNLTFVYLLFGVIILVYAFIKVFKQNFQNKILDNSVILIAALLFIVHTTAMGIRWYISGHAPWSDTYESLLYISWSAIFSGIIFFRKNMLALAASVIMTAIFMFTANLTNIDPQITNLVPVLKSYWLTIHVSIITGSYGFLAVGAMLGFMALILFIFRKNRPHIDKSIYQITAINEMAIIIGLAFLTIGNFIGGVWANESWGRYWGWDPKETWAYISIIIYAIVIHLRFIKKLDNPFVFSSASLVAFSSILMTYFGVNFYLSGMHSYATGDPVPVPMWVYVCVTIVFTTIAYAYKNRDLAPINFNPNSNQTK